MKKLSVLAGAVLAVACVSCTIDETTGVESAPESYVLTSLKAAGIMPVMNFEYDNLGRMTSCRMNDDEIYSMEYSGNSRVPSSITLESYNYYRPDPDEDREVRYLSEQSIATNIESNAKGYFTKVSFSERTWVERYDDNTGMYYITEEKPDNYWTSFEYDGQGHLVAVHDSDGENTSISWSGNRLTRYSSEDGICSFEYSDVQNKAGQWDPMLPWPGGPLVIGGWFGVAPGNFVSKYVYEDDTYDRDSMEVAYRLLDNGLIQTGRYHEMEDNSIMTITYTYKNIAK